jgi:hypothetical protein
VITPEDGTWTEENIKFGTCSYSTDAPTKIPTKTPTKIPSKIPTDAPTEIPTKIPTGAPTKIPTGTPTKIPTDIPTKIPTDIPTKIPTTIPTDIPTKIPTDIPTKIPTTIPTSIRVDSISFKNKVEFSVPLCLGVKDTIVDAPVITKACNSTDYFQQFQIDIYGRIHLRIKPTMCLQKKLDDVRVARCRNRDTFKWAYNWWDSRVVQYANSLPNVLAIENDTPGVGKTIKLVSFNEYSQTQGWEVK